MPLIDNRSNQTSPKFTVITVTLNAEQTIEETVKSVLTQTYTDYEYIIIDGGSTDKTVEKIMKFASKITYLTSEPDEGIYSAFNKGLRIAAGEMIGILNGDDQYLPSTLELVALRDRDAESNLRIVYGGVLVNTQKEKSEFIHHKNLKESMILHPTCFVASAVYSKLGNFDTSYRVAGDYEFISKCAKNNVEFLPIEAPLALYTKGGFSERNWRVSVKETLLVQVKYWNLNYVKAKYKYMNLMVKNYLRRQIHKVSQG